MGRPHVFRFYHSVMRQNVGCRTWPAAGDDEEIRYRIDVFSLDGTTGSQRELIRWLLGACADDWIDVDAI